MSVDSHIPVERPARSMPHASRTVRPSAAPHVRDQIEEFVARRLGDEAERVFEAHLLVCDECFTAYFVRTMETL